jgi:hypothetical protein
MKEADVCPQMTQINTDEELSFSLRQPVFAESFRLRFPSFRLR